MLFEAIYLYLISATGIGSSPKNIFFSSAHHSKPLYVSIMSSLYSQHTF